MFTIACHGTAMISMLLFLLPGVPGGPSDLVQRATYLSQHSLQWKIGWFPWQMTAMSDIILAVALFRLLNGKKLVVWIGLIMTLLAIAFEQPWEYRWVTSGIDLAKEAVAMGNYSNFSAFESDAFRMTSLWAAMFYTLAAIAWSYSFATLKIWNRFLTILSVILWSLLLAISGCPIFAPSLDLKLVSVGNALGFNLMMVWFITLWFLMRKRRLDHSRS